MELDPRQVEIFRKPFDEVGAFKDVSDAEVKRILGEVVEIWLTLARLSLKSRKEATDSHGDNNNP